MDDRGRLAQPLTREGHPRLDPGRVKASRRTASFWRAPKRFGSHAAATRFARALRRLSPVLDLKLPRGVGLVTAFLIVFSGIAFGVVRGGHLETVIAQFKDARDATANIAGFRIASIALAGGTEVSREQILGTAGVTGRSSLLFLDAEGARARLKANPWIKEATILQALSRSTAHRRHRAAGFRALAEGRPRRRHRRRWRCGAAFCRSALRQVFHSLSAAAPRAGPPNFSLCLIAIPRFAISFAPPFWSANGAGIFG